MVFNQRLFTLSTTSSAFIICLLISCLYNGTQSAGRIISDFKIPLPSSPGPFSVGTTTPVEMIDYSRLDPFAPDVELRFLMV